MKKLLTSFILAISCLITVPAATAGQLNPNAVADDLSNLPEDKQLEIAKLISDSKTAEKNAPVVKQETMDKWVGYGERLGKALGGAAKELGIAVNDFAKTPVGILATITIVYSFIGESLMGYVIGTFGLLLMSYVWMKVWRSITIESIEYEPSCSPIGRLFGLRSTKVIRNGDRFDSQHFFAFIAGFVIIIGFVVIVS